MVAEIALAFTLLSVSGLLISQLKNLTRTSPGFAPDHLLTFQLNLAGANQPKPNDVSAYQERLLQTLNAVPGVTSTALANQVPMNGCCFGTVLFPEGQTLNPDSIRPLSLMIVTQDYFKTLRIPLHRGRLLNQHDTNESLIPVVIDESAARLYWPNKDPLNAYGRLGSSDGSRVRVVGIVGDIRNEGLGEASRPELYLVNAIAPVNPMNFIVSSTQPPNSLIPSIRSALRNADPTQPMYAVRSMDEIIASSLTFQRLDSVVIGFFTLAALLMASLGVYGVTAYSVRLRTVEIGTRMALGATGRDVLRLVIGSGLSMAAYGIVLGALSVAAVSLLVIRFFNIHDVSPAPYLYAITAITGLALFSSSFPAWRATLLSPVVAIRNESDSIWTTTRRSFEKVIGLAFAPDNASSVDSAVLVDFIEASRRADSFSEALGSALALIGSKVHAKSVLLLENAGGPQYNCAAAIPDGCSRALTIPSNGFLLNRLRFYHSPLAFTAQDLDTSLRWAAEQKPQHLSEIEALKQSDIRLAMALRSKNEIVGLLLLSAPIAEAAYSSADTHMLRAWGAQFALMLENARLTNRVVEQETLRRDVALAVEVQKRLLPQTAPQTARISTSAYTLPVRSVGGDYYDFLDAGDHNMGIALADVAGKGIAAGLIMAVVHASLRIVAAEKNVPLPELARKMNSFLHRSTGSSSYATFFYAQVNQEGTQLRYVNAGHNPPFLLRAGQGSSIEELASGGMIIGMFPVASYEEAVLNLHPGDVLLAFTDGVTEALNPDEEEFGEERLKILLRSVAHLSVDEITANISKAMRKWIAEAAQHDDLTFIVLKINEELLAQYERRSQEPHDEFHPTRANTADRCLRHA